MARSRRTPTPRSSVGGDRGSLTLVASAEHINPRTAGSGQLQRLFQPWQVAALAYYDSLEVCNYPSQFYARALSRVRLYAAKRSAQGEIEELPEEHPASQLFERVKDPGGAGHTQLLTSYGQLQYVIGDGYLTVTEVDGEEQWEYLSPLELRAKPGNAGFVRVKAPGLAAEDLTAVEDDAFEETELSDGPIGQDGKPKSAWVVRLHKPHPAYSKWADSAVRSMLTLFEELDLLQKSKRARLLSRAGSIGVLYVPHEISFDTQPEGVPDDDPNADPFQKQLDEALAVAIREPGSAAAASPIVLRGPATIGEVPAKEAIFLIKLHDESEVYPEDKAIETLMLRIARGSDMPPEELMGISQGNHWSAWLIDETKWQSHLQPVTERFCADITGAYLRPMCLKENVADAESILVWYDAAGVVIHPDRAKDIRQAYIDGAANGETYRDSIGLSDENKQSEEEHAEFLAIALRDVSMLPGHEDEAGLGDEPLDGTGADVIEIGPPAVQPEEMKPEDALVASILGAAELSVLRARELAGSRLRSKMRGCEECLKTVDGIPNPLVASAVGAAETKNWDQPTHLVAGAAEVFKQVAGRMGLSNDASLKLAQQIEAHAARHLFSEDPAPLPAAFRRYVEMVVPNGRS